MSTYIKKYHTLGTYNGYDSKMEPLVYTTKENYGAFSLSAAVRYPYSPLRTDPYYKQPEIPGVN